MNIMSGRVLLLSSLRGDVTPDSLAAFVSRLALVAFVSVT